MAQFIEFEFTMPKSQTHENVDDAEIEQRKRLYKIYQHARNIYCMINGQDLEDRHAI